MCPMQNNLIQNGSFETLNTGCNPSSLTIINNDDCLPPWIAPTGSPLIPSGVPAPDGNYVLCTSTNETGVSCFNESFAQTVNLVPGQTYQLSFRVRKTIGSEPTSIHVYMANGLPNQNTNSATSTPCLPVAGSWQQLYSGDIITGSEFQLVTVTFTQASAQNNQIYFFPTIGNAVTNNAQFICWDDIQLTCASMGTAGFSEVYQGGQSVNFTGTFTTPGPQAVSWCWDFGDGTTGTGQNITHTYQQDGTYQVCLTVTDDRGCTAKYCREITFSQCNCSETPLVLDEPDKIIDWNGAISMDQDVIIPPGFTLNLFNATVRIKKGCKFVVMRGARMNANGSLLTSSCEGPENRWEGILVWGNDALNHTAAMETSTGLNDPGVFQTIREVTIENARNALQAQRWWGDRPANEAFYASAGFIPYDPNNQAFRGGLVLATDVYFHNNRKSGEFLSYSKVSNSRFQNCDFECTYGGNACSGLEGVTIWEYNNILFEGCKFKNIKERGVVVADASVTVRESLFDGNQHGIAAATTSTALHNIFVGAESDPTSSNEFSNNVVGVYSYSGARIVNAFYNRFLNNFAGIYLRQASESLMYRNYFANHFVAGTVFDQTGTGFLNKLDCNEFTADRFGIYAWGRNRGVKFLDNTFNTARADVYIQPSDNGQMGAIAFFQGQQGSPVYNLFSTAEADNDVVSPLVINEQFRYFPPLYLPNPAIQDRLIPDCDVNSACGVVNEFVNAIPYFDEEYQGCLSLDILPAPFSEPTPCLTRECLEDKKLRMDSLYALSAAAPENDIYGAQLQEVQFEYNRDKGDLIAAWQKTANHADLNALLAGSSEYGDQKIYYTLALMDRNYPAAALRLEALPENTQDRADFKAVQWINLAFRSADSLFVLTAEQDDFLKTVAETGQPESGPSATGLYYVLTGQWIHPELSLPEEAAERSQKSTTNGKGILPVAISPNPARDILRVTISGATDQPYTVHIVDLHGKPVSTTAAFSGDNSLITSGLNGIYFLSVRDSAGVLIYTSTIVIH